uniref:Uncharacterized protein n=1 Tax=Panagrellus redivivus TaxID=6233 RepID=A0A7E4ZSL0_PANRE
MIIRPISPLSRVSDRFSIVARQSLMSIIHVHTPALGNSGRGKKDLATSNLPPPIKGTVAPELGLGSFFKQPIAHGKPDRAPEGCPANATLCADDDVDVEPNLNQYAMLTRCCS